MKFSASTLALFISAALAVAVPEAAPVCNTRLCLHYVPTTADAPPSPDWVNQNLAVMDSIWSCVT